MGKSSGDACVFKNCGNNRRKCKDVVPAVQFFRFSVKDQNRCLEWILKSGIEEKLLKLDDKQLTGRRVCSVHFSPASFNNVGKGRGLCNTAIPESYLIDEEEGGDGQAGPMLNVLIDHAYFNIGEVVAAIDPAVNLNDSGEDEMAVDATMVVDDDELECEEEEEVRYPTKPIHQSGNINDMFEDVQMEIVGIDHEEEVHATLEYPEQVQDEASDELPSMPDIDYSEDSDEETNTVSESSSSDEERIEEDITPRKLKLMSRIGTLSSLVKRKRSTISSLKRQPQPVTVPEALDVLSQFTETDEADVFLRMQARPPQSREEWTREEQNLALSLYYKSPSSYMYMRDKIKLKLPSYSSIVSWINLVNLRTGFSDEIFERLQAKVKTMEDSEKECVLIFDEMSIKKWLEYDSKLDLVEGFEDLGPLGRKPYVAKQAMVFMVRGLKYNWKQHVAYFLAYTSVNFTDLSLLIDHCLEKLFALGLKVRAIACDQGSSNRALYNLMGVTVDKPFFFHGENKIYALYDVPHLLKSIRNNLKNHDLIVEGERVSWKDIVKFHDIDAKRGTTGSRAAPKLTVQHLFPGAFAKMSVKLAAQVFSHSVKAGMATAINTGELTSPSAESTKNFIGKMNDLFDSLNSRHPNDATPHRRPLADGENNIPLKCLREAQTWLPTMSLADKRGVNPPSFEGLLQTVNAVIFLWRDLSSEGTKYLLTSRLNQDPLENSFAVLRNRAGCNDNPTPRQFRKNLQTNMCIHLMNPPKSSNCEPDDNVWLTSIDREDPEVALDMPITSTATVVSATSTSLDDPDEPAIQQAEVETDNTGRLLCGAVTTEQCAVVYIAGWLARRCLKKFDCDACKCSLVQQGQHLAGDHQGLIHARAFMTKANTDLGNLTAPTDSFAKTIDDISETFSQYYDALRHEPNIREKMRNIIINKHLIWLDANHPCSAHRRFISDKLITTKIFHDAKRVARDIRDCPTKSSVIQITCKRTATKRKKSEKESHDGSKMIPKLKKLKHL